MTFNKEWTSLLRWYVPPCCGCFPHQSWNNPHQLTNSIMNMMTERIVSQEMDLLTCICSLAKVHQWQVQFLHIPNQLSHICPHWSMAICCHLGTMILQHWSFVVQVLLLSSSPMPFINTNRNSKTTGNVWLYLQPHCISQLWPIKDIAACAATLYVSFDLPHQVLQCHVTGTVWYCNLATISSLPWLYNSTVQYPLADLQLLYFANQHKLAQVMQPPPSIRIAPHRTYQAPSSWWLPTMHPIAPTVYPPVSNDHTDLHSLHCPPPNSPKNRKSWHITTVELMQVHIHYSHYKYIHNVLLVRQPLHNT